MNNNQRLYKYLSNTSKTDFHHKSIKVLLRFAKQNRLKWTKEEKLLNGWLSNWKIKHQNQAVIHPYIADILLTDYPVIIELDGSQHEFNKTYDNERNWYMTQQGYIVLRIQNIEMNDKALVKKRVFDAINGFVI